MNTHYKIYFKQIAKNIFNRMKNLKSLTLKQIEHKSYSKLQTEYDMELSFSEACATFKTREKIYAYFHHYFHNRSPKIIREHKKYIIENQKGFGEEAFHAMWFLLLLEFNPANMLEIGVYRGQVISLWALIDRYMNRACEIHAISPFSFLGDAVSEYLKNLDYLEDTLNTFSDWVTYIYTSFTQKYQDIVYPSACLYQDIVHP